MGYEAVLEMVVARQSSDIMGASMESTKVSALRVHVLVVRLVALTYFFLL